MNFLFDKKTIAVFIVTIAVVTSYFIANKYQTKKEISMVQPQNTLAVVSDNQINSTVATNTDWKATLYKSGLISTSTKDSSVVDLTQTNQKTASNTSNQTMTDQFSQELFSQFVALKKNNNLTPRNQQQLIQNMVSSYNPPALDNHFSVNNLTIVDNPTYNQLKAFGNNFALIENKYQNFFQTSPVDILNQSLQQQNSNSIQELTDMATAYNNMTNDLLKIAIPKSMRFVHLQIVNNYFGMGQSVADMNVFSKDPIRGVAGLKRYQEYIYNQGFLFKQIADYFNQNGIIFDKGEQGAIWNTF